MSILGTVSSVASSFWAKIVQLWQKDVVPFFTAEEQELLQLLQPLWGQLEAAAYQDAVIFIKGVVAAAPTTKTIPEWETVVLNLAEVAGGSLWTTIQSMTSNALQTLIGLVLTWLEAQAAAKAGATAPAPALS